MNSFCHLSRDHIYTVDIETANTEEIFFNKVSAWCQSIYWDTILYSIVITWQH